MKILHTADWHLGKRLDYYSRIEEQKDVLNEICEIADQQKIDLVLVSGDLFDTFNPPVEATDLLYQTLKRLTNNGKRPVVAIAGNHDSPDRIDSPDPLARACGIIFMGYPNAEIKPFTLKNGYHISHTDRGFIEIQLEHIPYPIRVIATPYANEIRLKQFLSVDNKDQELQAVLQKSWADLANTYCDNQGVNILLTHLYMLERGGKVLEEPEGEKPIKVGNADIVYTDAIPPQIQYTALGHLHRCQQIGSNLNPVLYSGSPLSYSFAEAGQEKKVVIVDAKPDEPCRITTIPLKSGKKLHRKHFEDIDLAVQWLNENPETLVELTIISDTFITSQELKRLHEAHKGIIHIIPVIKNQNAINEEKPIVRLDQDLDSLFKDYFKSKHGQDPNEEILMLFREVTHLHQDTEQ